MRKVHTLLNIISQFSQIVTAYITRKGLDYFIEENISNIYGLILDLGCGGIHKTELSNKKRIIGFDVRIGEGVDVAGDAHCLPFRDNSFDAIICKQVLEHLYHPHIAVDEMLRILKPGGKVVMSAPFYYPIHFVPIDYFRFTRYGLEKLFQKWEEVKIEAQYNLLGSIALHLAKFGTARTLIIRILSPLIAIVAMLLMLLDKPFTKIFGKFKHIEWLTTHYFLSATKVN